MKRTQIAVDVAKSVFELAVSSRPGRVDRRQRVSRQQFPVVLAAEPPAEVIMEACGSAHHWGRALRAKGHTVTLLHPGDVARYRDGNKTDRADAKALLEAVRNEALDPVPVKSPEQQALLALHRIRAAYLRTRTARINELRGHLREFGCVIPLGARHVSPAAATALAGDGVPAFVRPALQALLDEIGELAAKADGIRQAIEHLAGAMPAAQLLLTVPGIGVLTATALVAAIGTPHRFRSGRDFAAYLGLTPREHSSGSGRRLGAITKRGNGARSALRAGAVSRCPDNLRVWAGAVAARHGHNVAAVALANKLARVCWRVWRDERPFERREAIA
jgi:transposase